MLCLHAGPHRSQDQLPLRGGGGGGETKVQGRRSKNFRY